MWGLEGGEIGRESPSAENLEEGEEGLALTAVAGAFCTGSGACGAEAAWASFCGLTVVPFGFAVEAPFGRGGALGAETFGFAVEVVFGGGKAFAAGTFFGFAVEAPFDTGGVLVTGALPDFFCCLADVPGSFSDCSCAPP